MSQLIHTIVIDSNRYSMLLPDWETDYIQGMLANKAVPYEHSMLNAMRKTLQRGDLILDVGANIGNHTLYLAVVAGCRVVAFEPNPILAAPLLESIALNGLEEQVALIPKGVGATESKGVFKELKPSNLGAQSLSLIDETEKVTDTENLLEIIPLDSILFEQPVKAIKIDVEGMELDVLKGAKKLIEKDRPNLFIESHNTEQFMLIYKFLEEFGYVYWSTFNATPTNWFIPLSLAVKNNLQKNSLEQGKTFYKLWDERQRLKKTLLHLQENQNLTNSNFAELQAELDKAKAALKYPLLQSSEDTKRVSFLSTSFTSHPELDFGLDFSLPNQNQG